MNKELNCKNERFIKGNLCKLTLDMYIDSNVVQTIIKIKNIHTSSFYSYKPSADPDQMPKDAASNQCLHCLLSEFSIKI